MQMEMKITVNANIGQSEQRQVVEHSNYQHAHIQQSSGYNHREAMFEIYRKVPESSKWGYILLIIGLIISIFLSGLALFATVKTSSLTAKALVTLAFFSLAIFVYGFFAIRWFTKKVEEFLADYEKNDPEVIDQSKERSFLNLFIYLLMLDCIIFIILGVGSIAFKDQIEMEIKAIAQDQNEWKTYFGKLAYNVVINNYRAVLYAFGGISFLLCLVTTILLINLFKGLGAYRTWQTIIEFIAVIFFLLGFAFLYLALYVYEYREVSNVDQAIPAWAPVGLLGISVIAIILAIIGYVSAFMESLRSLKIFIVLAIIYTIVILILSSFGGTFLTKVDKIIGQKNCLKLLDRINQEHLVKYAGCKQKYIFYKNDLSNMKCPKDRILIAWEVNLGKPEDQQTNTYGCVDMSCCNQTFAYIKSKMNWLIIISFNLVGAGVLLIIGTYYMIKKLAEGIEQGTSDKKVRWVFLIFTIITVTLFGLFMGLSPQVPAPDPVLVTSVDAASRINSQVDTNIVPNSSNDITTATNQNVQEKLVTQGLYDVIINEITSGCGNNGACPYAMKYSYQITSTDGSFSNTAKRSTDSIIISQSNENGFTFTGDIKAIKAGFLVSFDYKAKCPLIPSWVNLEITGTAARTLRMMLEGKQTSNELLRYLDTTTTADTNTSTTKPTINVDISTVNLGITYTYYKAKKDFSFTTSDTQVVIGRVLFVSNNLERKPCQNCIVYIQSVDFPACTQRSFTTDSQGYWKSDVYNVPTNNTAVRYTLTIKYTDYVTYSKTITLGGIGWTAEVDVGNMDLFSSVVIQEKTVAPLKFQTVTSTVTVPVSTTMNSVVATDQTASATNTIVSTNGSDSTTTTTNTIPPATSAVTTTVTSTSDNNTSNSNTTPGSTSTGTSGSTGTTSTGSNSTGSNSTGSTSTGSTGTTSTGSNSTGSNSTGSTSTGSTGTISTGSNSTGTSGSTSSGSNGSSNTDTSGSTNTNGSSTTDPSSSTGTTETQSTITISQSTNNNPNTLQVTPATLVNSGVTSETSAVIETGTTVIPIVITQGNQAQDNPIVVQEPLVIPNNQVATETVVSTGSSSVTITQTQTLVVLEDPNSNVNSFSTSAAAANGVNIPTIAHLDSTVPSNIVVENNSESTTGITGTNTSGSTTGTTGTNTSGSTTGTTGTNTSGSTTGTGTNTSGSTTGTTGTNTSGSTTGSTSSSSGSTTGNTGASTTGNTSNSGSTSSSSSGTSTSTQLQQSNSVAPPVIATSTNDLPISTTSQTPTDASNQKEITPVSNALIVSMVLSSVTNNPLPGVKIYLFRGNRKFDNEQITPTNSTDTTTVNTSNNNNINGNGNGNGNQAKTDLSKDPSLVASTISDQFGNFGFGNLGPNKYTLVFELDGYYRETVYFDIIGNKSGPIPTVSLSPLIPLGQIRFVLSWPNGPKDLDIYAMFKVSKLSKCDVYFGRKSCVGAALDVDNRKGGKLGVETITINSLGKYIYMFVINKYIDNSQGVAAGDSTNIMQLDDNNPVTSTTSTLSKVPDNTLAGSLGTISVYAPNFAGPVYQLTVPDDIKASNVLTGNVDDAKNFNWLLAFCLDGTKGLSSLKTVNKFSKTKPDFTTCEGLFK
jgi:hypothetical protein